jgi:hypothetical protein
VARSLLILVLLILSLLEGIAAAKTQPAVLAGNCEYPHPNGLEAPKLIWGTVKTEGGLDKDVVRRYLRQRTAQLVYCYEKRLQVDPDARGTTVMTIVIDASGVVKSAKATGMTEDMTSCFEQAAATITFPKPTDGGVVKASVPISFRAGDPKPTKAQLAWVAALPAALERQSKSLLACYAKQLAVDPAAATVLPLEVYDPTDKTERYASETGADADSRDVLEACVDETIPKLALGAVPKGGVPMAICPVAFLPAGGDWSIDALVAEKTSVIAVDAGGAVTVDGKSLAPKEKGTVADALADAQIARAIVEIDPAALGSVWKPIVANASVLGDVRFARPGKKAGTWVAVPGVMGEAAQPDDPTAATVNVGGAAIMITMVTDPSTAITIAMKQGTIDRSVRSALARELAKLRKRGARGSIDVAVADDATYGALIDTLDVVHAAGFALFGYPGFDGMALNATGYGRAMGGR